MNIDWVQVVLIVVVASAVWGFVSRFAQLLTDDLWAWWKRRGR